MKQTNTETWQTLESKAFLDKMQKRRHQNQLKNLLLGRTEKQYYRAGKEYDIKDFTCTF